MKQVLLVILLCLYFGLFFLFDWRIGIAEERLDIHWKNIEAAEMEYWTIVTATQRGFARVQQRIEVLENRIKELEEE